MARTGHIGDITPAAVVTDPVCGMSIDPGSAVGPVEHDGRPHWFCSDSCRQRFLADPGRYATADAGRSDPDHVTDDAHHAAAHEGHQGADRAGAQPAATTTKTRPPALPQVVEYTCPMDSMCLS